MPKIPIKTLEEIQIMREGGKVLHNVLDMMEREVRPGVKTSDLDRMAEKMIHEAGMKPSFKGYGASKYNQGFPATLCVSINDEVVHGIPSQRVLQEGDIVGIDCGVYHCGLHTDSARTFLVGTVKNEVAHFVKITQKALKKCINKIKEGIRLGDVSATIQKTIEQQGYSVVRNCTGHGVGCELHEPPEILNYGKKGTGIMLQAGMVLAIEPISVMGSEGDTYDDKQDGWTVKTASGALSAHFEHTVLVTEKGFEILT